MGFLRILLVEDDDDTAEALCFWFEADGYRCDRAATCHEALQALESARHRGEPDPDAMVLDLMLPDGDGVELGEYMAHLLPQCPIIIHSAAPNARLGEAGRRLHAAAVLRKPCACATIAKTVREAIEIRRDGVRAV